MAGRPAPARCVLLFARAPRAEAMSKRLARGEALFALAQERVVRAAAALPGVDLVLVPPSAQSGGDFGARLQNAFRRAVRLGYGEIVAVPGDVPEIEARDLAAAFRALSGSDTVLGPSPDGGVWLIGLRAGHVALSDFFEGVPWRTSRVFEELLAQAPRSIVLAEKGDVDRRADARRLREILRKTPREGRDALLGKTLDRLLGRRAASPFEEPLPTNPPVFSGPPPARAPPLLLPF